MIGIWHGEIIGIECDGPSHFDSEGNRTERDLERHINSRGRWNLHEYQILIGKRFQQRNKENLDLFSHRTS